MTSTVESKSAASNNRFITEPVLYKTKMCRSFLRDGFCAYETKCMFAHGTYDLRTTESNMKEGLTTEERVKRHQTRSIIMLKQKARKERPPTFQEALVQAAENDKVRSELSTPATTPNASTSTMPADIIAPSMDILLAPSTSSDSLCDQVGSNHHDPTPEYNDSLTSSYGCPSEAASESDVPRIVRVNQPYAVSPPASMSHFANYSGYYPYGQRYPYGYCDCPTCNAALAATPPPCTCPECQSQ